MKYNLAIIEDNNNVSNFIEEYISKNFSSINIFFKSCSPQESIDKFKSSQIPDIIILDFILRQGTGFEVLDWIESHSSKTVLVLLITGYLQDGFDFDRLSNYCKTKIFILNKPISEKFGSLITILLLQNSDTNNIGEYSKFYSKKDYLPEI